MEKILDSDIIEILYIYSDIGSTRQILKQSQLSALFLCHVARRVAPASPIIISPRTGASQSDAPLVNIRPMSMEQNLRISVKNVRIQGYFMGNLFVDFLPIYLRDD